jgi:diguanylate cyclase (GGDEF)-like protein
MSDAVSIFVFESHAGLMKQCVSVVREAGFNPVPTQTPEEATAAIEDCTSLQALLVSNTPAGVEFSQYVHEFTLCRAPLLAMIDRNQEDPGAVMKQMEADGFLLRPFSASTLQSMLSVATHVTTLRDRLQKAERELAETAPQLRRLASAINSRTGFYQFEFIKDLLVVEVRRAKRYGYPLAILLVGLDAIPALHELNRPNLQREITAGLAVAIGKSIRDIDIPIHYADDRILVFLPHTDLAGAEEVGRRIKRRIKRITYRGENLTAQLTASVGVAGISAGENLTFSRLIKDATTALKAAQLKGGDKVMKRVSKPAPAR